MKRIWIFCLMQLAIYSATAHDFTLNQGYVAGSGFFEVLPCEKVNHLVLVTVKLRGKPHRFLLDTGAPTVISSSLQRKAGYPLMKEMPAVDFNSSQKHASVVQLEEISLGSLTVKDIPAVVVADDNPVFRHLDITGIIGSNMLRHMIVKISATHGTVTLTDEPDLLNLAGIQASELFIDKDIQSSPVVRVQLGGHTTEELLFDSGFDGFYDPAAAKLDMLVAQGGMRIEGRGQRGAIYALHGTGQEEEQIKVLIPEYRVGDYTFRNVVAYTGKGDNSRMGARLLTFGDVVIDYLHQRFYFLPDNPSVTPCIQAVTNAYYAGVMR